MAGSSPGEISLQREFRAALSALGASRRATALPTAPGKALELWLLFKIAHDLSTRGWKVTIRDGADKSLSSKAPFVSRAQPGRIAASNATKPGFIRLDRPAGLLPKERFELHGSLQFRGRSRACHEVDISVLPATLGTSIRSNGGGRPTGMPPVAIECKHHHKGRGSIGEAREKLARLFDMTYVRRCHPRNGWQVFWLALNKAVGWGQRYHWYKDRFRNGLYAIARTSGFQKGALRLLGHYELKAYPEITRVGGVQPLLNAVHDELS